MEENTANFVREGVTDANGASRWTFALGAASLFLQVSSYVL